MNKTIAFMCVFLCAGVTFSQEANRKYGKVKVTANSQPQWLEDALTAGTGITLTTTGNGITVASTATTAGYVTTAQLVSATANLATTAELVTATANLATTAELSTATAILATRNYIENRVIEYTRSTGTNFSTTFTAGTGSYPNQYIEMGYVWPTQTTTAPYTQQGTLSFYSTSARLETDTIYKAEIDLIIVQTSGATSAGVDVISVDDSTSFTAYDLVLVDDGDGSEYLRIASISGNDLTMSSNTVTAHGADTNIIIVEEFGGFMLRDSSSTNKIWGKLEGAGSKTIEFTFKVVLFRRF